MDAQKVIEALEKLDDAVLGRRLKGHKNMRDEGGIHWYPETDKIFADVKEARRLLKQAGVSSPLEENTWHSTQEPVPKYI